MEKRSLYAVWVRATVIAVVALTPGGVTGRASLVSFAEATEAPGKGGQVRTAVAPTSTSPRTPWGEPDLQGIWDYRTITPLERPKELAEKPVLTDEEAAALEERTAKARADDRYYWDRGSKVVADKRTSLIVDPPDGRVPPLTPEGRARAEAARAREQRTDSAEQRSLTERCITRTLPRLPDLYNNNYQIAQAPGYVVILMEMIHDARIIPLDGRPHLAQHLRQWHGDSRGRWEGNTLVVDTTNFTDKTNFRGSAENLHLVERFTRVDSDTINYEFTVDDPTTFTRPWTVAMPLRKTRSPIYEYACHEGNDGLADILSINRAIEKAAEEAAKKGSNGLSAAAQQPASAPSNPDWTRPFPPFRMIGNIYWVGTYDLSTYLITTPQGHILINTGVGDTAQQIRANVEALGFKLADTKILTATHGHYDHVAGMAELKRMTGAKLIVSEGDRELLESGGRADFRFGDVLSARFEPAKVDQTFKDGEKISLGGTELTAHLHAGHTKGATSFTLNVQEAGKIYRVIIANMGSINPGVTVSGMPKFPEISQAYTRTFLAQKDMKIDVWLASHAGQFGMHDKYKPGDPFIPERFVDPVGFLAAVQRLETAYLDQLARERRP